jgi:hypothetical protein
VLQRKISVVALKLLNKAENKEATHELTTNFGTDWNNRKYS